MSVEYLKRKKPTFTTEQLVTSSTAAKSFGKIRRQAKEQPQFIMENGNVETVLINYELYEELYSLVKELEEMKQNSMLSERIDRLNEHPQSSVSWKSIRRSE
ncbi:type II toxin-antitoxin system Phd/YefM family antitoxin [Paenisporosarcina cavernae]|uniref:Type II toxin-antitoxin system Phd/YefM family antitoxin n=1 Tax=Paenisporosarcina cavernae TaxID=2320858 RepID=A0A385YTG2_9BACL|nr:type II toxin-antitoxin system Phd/YefM family antitoxin [Paenisporosarcina cavernae]AYC28968.1 type II toxin-antitoxin system Phd/YefM family antitoxin [Paenisporosarcina cavernae]